MPDQTVPGPHLVAPSTHPVRNAKSPALAALDCEALSLSPLTAFATHDSSVLRAAS